MKIFLSFFLAGRRAQRLQWHERKPRSQYNNEIREDRNPLLTKNQMFKQGD